MRKTFEFLKGRPYAPAMRKTGTMRSSAGPPSPRTRMPSYDDLVQIDANTLEPTVTWGINPGQAIAINQNIPSPDSCARGG
jgi:3-isopropylmalate/(R)-2-methylmalate dehydratase large subunit